MTFAGQYVLGATAIDADIGLNGEIEYSLFGADSNNFEVKADTGVITAKRTLTDASTTYVFYIRATDKVSSVFV